MVLFQFAFRRSGLGRPVPDECRRQAIWGAHFSRTGRGNLVMRHLNQGQWRQPQLIPATMHIRLTSTLGALGANGTQEYLWSNASKRAYVRDAQLMTVGNRHNWLPITPLSLDLTTATQRRKFRSLPTRISGPHHDRRGHADFSNAGFCTAGKNILELDQISIAHQAGIPWSYKRGATRAGAMGRNTLTGQPLGGITQLMGLSPRLQVQAWIDYQCPYDRPRAYGINSMQGSGGTVFRHYTIYRDNNVAQSQDPAAPRAVGVLIAGQFGMNPSAARGRSACLTRVCMGWSTHAAEKEQGHTEWIRHHQAKVRTRTPNQSMGGGSLVGSTQIPPQ
jgi:hypothetical protein